MDELTAGRERTRQIVGNSKSRIRAFLSSFTTKSTELLYSTSLSNTGTVSFSLPIENLTVSDRFVPSIQQGSCVSTSSRCCSAESQNWDCGKSYIVKGFSCDQVSCINTCPVPVFLHSRVGTYIYNEYRTKLRIITGPSMYSLVFLFFFTASFWGEKFSFDSYHPS